MEVMWIMGGMIRGCRSGKRETRNEEEGGSRTVATCCLVWKSKTGKGEWK
jgi:hypothetical protein